MPPGPNVGTAYVTVRADTSGLSRQIRRELETQLGGAGDDAGAAFNRRFLSRLDRLRGSIENSFRSAGERGGRQFFAGFDRTISSDLDSSIGRLVRRFGDGGRDGGREFSEGFGDGFNLNLGPINLQFDSLGQAIVRLAPFVVAAANALAGLAAQGAALVSALASAASSTFLFVPAITALITGVAVAVIGFNGFKDAVTEGGEALAALPGPMRETAQAVADLGDHWTSLQRAIQVRLFEDLAGVVGDLGTTVFPVLRRELQGTAQVLNRFFRELGAAATSTENLRDLSTILASQNTILDSLLGAVIPLGAAFRDLFVESLPFAEDLASAIQQGAERLAELAAAGRETGEIAEFFQRSYENASTLLRGIRDLTVGIVAFFSAGREEGASMLETFADLAARFREFAESVAGHEAFQQFFEFGAVVVGHLGQALSALMGVIVPVFNGISDILGVLAPLLDLFEELANIIGQNLTTVFSFLTASLGVFVTTLVDALMPVLPVINESLATLAASMGLLFSTIAQSLMPLIPTFAEILTVLAQTFTQVLEAMAPIIPSIGDLILVSSELISGVLEPLVPALAAVITTIADQLGPVLEDLIDLVVETIENFAPFIVQLATELAPLIVQVTRLFVALLPAIVPVAQFITAVFTPILIVLIATITTLVRWISNTIAWLEDMPGPIQNVASMFSGRFASAVDTASQRISGVISWIQDAIGWLGNMASEAGSLGQVLVGPLGGALSDVGGFLGDVGDAVASVIGWFGDMISTAGSLIGALSILSGPISAIENAFSGIASVVEGAIGAIDRLIGAIQSIPTPNLDFSWLPGFAAGGIVSGPTKLIAGEAGAEAIIPLQRPLQLVDPSVRGLAALIRGQAPAMANGGIAGAGRSVTVLPGAIQVVTPARDPVIVAEQVLDRLVLETMR